MTTTITVQANHGWPVDVTVVDPNGDEGATTRVPANVNRDFVVHSTQDLYIHEVQPGEIEAEATEDDGA